MSQVEWGPSMETAHRTRQNANWRKVCISSKSKCKCNMTGRFITGEEFQITERDGPGGLRRGAAGRASQDQPGGCKEKSISVP